MRRRASGKDSSERYAATKDAYIAPKLFTAANTSSTALYLRACREHELEVHPARFVPLVPEFFIKFLTRPGDIVLGPFSGSGVVGYLAENLGRKWISSEINPEYVLGSAFRFNGLGEQTYRRYRNLLPSKTP